MSHLSLEQLNALCVTETYTPAARSNSCGHGTECGGMRTVRCKREKGHMGPHVHFDDYNDEVWRWVCGMVLPFKMHNIYNLARWVRRRQEATPERVAQLLTADPTYLLEMARMQLLLEWEVRCGCQRIGCTFCDPSRYGIEIAE